MRASFHATMPVPRCILVMLAFAFVSGCSTIVVVHAIDGTSSEVQAAPNAIVAIDGEEVGRTDASGTFEHKTQSGTHEIAAYVPGLIGGRSSVDIESGQTKTIEVVLTGEGLGAISNYTISVKEAPNGVLPSNFSSFTIEVTGQKGQHVRLSSLNYILSSSKDGAGLGHIENLFSISADGSISASDLVSLRQLVLGWPREITLEINAEDKGLLTYSAILELRVQ